ncbi:MAG: hypothetical protein HKN82_10130 [Akkermansiaceae bacterium]|nr:hypothetical protein [Akkermansiaceae bacterium]NNM30334.1 hypothetical protein [Akkermansiaceae bacterium]
MKPDRKEELLTRWLDDVLTGEERAEMEPLLKEHPEWEREREEFLQMRATLRAEIPAEEEPPYPDFFNAHLERLVRERRGAVAPSGDERPGFWATLRWWLAPAAAGAMLLAFLAGMQIRDPGSEGPPLAANIMPAVYTYTPVASVKATTMEDASLGGTVIVLDGLEAIPDSVDLFQTAGYSPRDRSVFISTDRTF